MVQQLQVPVRILESTLAAQIGQDRRLDTTTPTPTKVYTGNAGFRSVESCSSEQPCSGVETNGAHGSKMSCYHFTDGLVHCEAGNPFVVQ